MSGLVRLVDRLRREPEVLADIFRRAPLQMRHFITKAFEMLVHPPTGRGNPAEAAFDEDELQLWEALGDAFDHEAGELRRHRVGVGMVLLDVKGGPAAS